MKQTKRSVRPLRVSLLAGVLFTPIACAPGRAHMTDAELHDLATRYAAAWSSQDPEHFGSFYAPDGSISVNDEAPAEGRPAVIAVARSFMAAFPDMVVRLDSLGRDGDAVLFYWLWTGTNTGPGGTGAAVRLTGHERWTFTSDGLIARSEGHYDEAEYRRQLQGGPAAGE